MNRCKRDCKCAEHPQPIHPRTAIAEQPERRVPTTLKESK